LEFRISAETSETGDRFQRASDSFCADFNVFLQVLDGLAKKICVCRNVGVNRQTD